jgi:hypothetical protein
MGATLIGLVSSFPQVIWISEHKSFVFLGSALMLFLSSIMQYLARNQPCPIDPELAKACTVGRKWSKRITIFSVVVWLLGAGFAFIPRLFR